MKYGLCARLYGRFYYSSCDRGLKSKCGDYREIRGQIRNEYRQIVLRAKDIGKSKLLSVYFMAAYFIAMNRSTGLSAEENYVLFQEGLYRSNLFHKVLGNANAYLDPKRMPGRKEWERVSHERKFENDWVVDVLEKTEQYELGYDYHSCGVCSLCRDEGCPELARYLCRLDYMMADIMDMKLERTQTIAEGANYCDFRYSRKQHTSKK